MKLYRIIPDQIARGYDIQGISEDALYKLGYISVSSHLAYFTLGGSIDYDNELYRNREKGIFFFKNPWDAVFCSWFTFKTGIYSNLVVRVCEYEFPDEIINNSPHDEGLYYGFGVEEYKIPISLLEGYCDIIRSSKDGIIELPEELNKQLKDEKKKLNIETCEIAKSINEKVYNYLKEFTEDENVDKLHKFNLRELELVMKSKTEKPFITGNMFTVTSRDRRWLSDIDVKSLVDKSNGVLTYDNCSEVFKKFLDEAIIAQKDDNNPEKHL